MGLSKFCSAISKVFRLGWGRGEGLIPFFVHSGYAIGRRGRYCIFRPEGVGIREGAKFNVIYRAFGCWYLQCFCVFDCVSCLTWRWTGSSECRCLQHFCTSTFLQTASNRGRVGDEVSVLQDLEGSSPPSPALPQSIHARTVITSCSTMCS